MDLFNLSCTLDPDDQCRRWEVTGLTGTTLALLSTKASDLTAEEGLTVEAEEEDTTTANHTLEATGCR